MKLNAAMAAMVRRAGASAVVALALAAAPASAGDRALADFIGFSEEGRYFAFEEYGIQDGSGFPYSTIYLIDLSSDTWVQGSPYRYRADDETETLARARNESAAMAAGKIAELGIDQPADVIALNGDGEAGDGLTLEFAQPGYFPGETLDEYVLTLDVFDADTVEDCSTYTGEPAKGYALTLVDNNGMHELHRDTGTLPKSRGCITGYRLYAVVTPQYAAPYRNGVAIISTYPVGFEGPDRRFLAVPTSY
jgi:predicted secreted protein